jgi:hypothetical protein
MFFLGVTLRPDRDGGKRLKTATPGRARRLAAPGHQNLEYHMQTILRLIGHGVGFTGVMIGLGSILRAIPASLPRLLPYIHGITTGWLTTAWIGGPLSIGLVAVAALILGGEGSA